MDPPDCDLAVMRRGSYDDNAASLRPVSIDPPSKLKVMKILLGATAGCETLRGAAFNCSRLMSPVIECYSISFYLQGRETERLLKDD